MWTLKFYISPHIWVLVTYKINLTILGENLSPVLVMAGYGYEVRSYNTYGGVTPVADKWMKPSYAESDHVTRRYEQPTESYIVKSERIIEQVRTPTVPEYSRMTPVDYGVDRNRWGTVPRAVDDRPRKVEEFITQVQTEASEPNLGRPHLLGQGGKQRQAQDPYSTSADYKHNSYPASEYGQRQLERDNWSRSSSPRRPRDVYSPPPPADYKSSHPSSEYGALKNTWGQAYSPVRDAEQTRTAIRPGGLLGNMSGRPEQLQLPVTPVSEHKHSSNSPPKDYKSENNPWVRNSQPGFLRSTNWRQTPNSTTQSASAGYDSYNNYKGNEMDKNKPGGNFYPQTENYKYISTEPSPQAARGAWTRPALGGWATTATQVTQLTKPTNNITEAVSFLAGALQQSSLVHTSPQPYHDTSLGAQKMDNYSESIDSREAQRRYGNLSGVPRARETYSTAIDSREAVRRYGGAAV